MKPEMNTLDQVETVRLSDGDMRVSVLNYGAVTQGWWYKGVPLILGFDDPKAYLTDTRYMGAIVGRVANRIGGAKFDLGGVRFALSANEGKNCLHGGEAGLSKQFWNIEPVAQNEVLLTYFSRDGESGFPGEVRFEVRICLQVPRLTYTMTAWPDRPTPISMTQHNYYTLGDSDGVDGHELTLASSRYLDIDDHGIPSGRVLRTHESKLDFREPKRIGSVAGGLDHYFCFDDDRVTTDPIAKVTAPSGLALTVFSDQPGAQVYSGYRFANPPGGVRGVCIEPSGYPNAPNVPSFPSVIHSPEDPYRQVLVLQVSGDRHES